MQPGFTPKWTCRMNDSAGQNCAATPPQSATSPEHREERFRTMQNLNPHSPRFLHHFPLGGPGFVGIKIVPGGVIFFTTEKFRSFKASATRPRESMYKSGSP